MATKGQKENEHAPHSCKPKNIFVSLLKSKEGRLMPLSVQHICHTSLTSLLCRFLSISKMEQSLQTGRELRHLDIALLATV